MSESKMRAKEHVCRGTEASCLTAFWPNFTRWNLIQLQGTNHQIKEIDLARYLGEGHGWEFVPGQLVLLAPLSQPLTTEDTCGGRRRDPHTVADEKDNIPGMWSSVGGVL